MDIKPQDYMINFSSSNINEEVLGSSMDQAVSKGNGLAPEHNGLRKVNAVKPRVSLLENFDPLYENSPVEETLLINDEIVSNNADEKFLDTDRTLIISRHASSTEKLLDISTNECPVPNNQINQSEIEVFNTPPTSPRKSLGNRTQESSKDKLQESFDETFGSSGPNSLNSVNEVSKPHITNPLSIPSITISESNSHSPTPDSSIVNGCVIASGDIELSPKSSSNSVSDNSTECLHSTGILSDHKHLQDTDTQEYFETHSTLSDLQISSNHNITTETNSSTILTCNNIVTNNAADITFDAGTESSESVEQEKQIDNIPPDSTQVESLEHTPSTDYVEENAYEKNETSSIKLSPVLKDSRRCSGSPAKCNSEIEADSVVDSDSGLENLTITGQPTIPANGEEVEIRNDSSVSNEPIKTDCLIGDFPLEGTVDISVVPISSIDIETLKSKMADLGDDLAKHQQENSELRLQLNAQQQARASLELEVRQKEEIIIKSQAESLKIEQKYKQEIKTLKEKVKENSTLIEKGDTHLLEDQLKEAQLKETKLITDLQTRTKREEQYKKLLEEYDRIMQHCKDERIKLMEKYEINQKHLANLELAFSDVHSKYEKAKENLQTMSVREEALIVKLELAQATNIQHEERYESLKQHAGNQIDKSNKENLSNRERYESEVVKLKAIIKRLEIKCSSLEISLQQKIEECEQLAALCDEVTGKGV